MLWYIDKNNKKAVSEILSYVMLIIIALALSVLVYAYLKVYVPKDKPICPDEISIYIKAASCKTGALGTATTNISLTLENKGMFDIHGAYIRFGRNGSKVLDLINDPLNSPSIFFTSISSPAELGLAPQRYQSGEIYSSTNYPAGNYTVEVQPAVFIGKKLVICEKAVARQDVECV